MEQIQQYKFKKVVKNLGAYVEALTAQLAQTNQQCREIEEVMIAIRENRFTAKNYVLPRCPYGRDQAANDA